MTHTFFSIQGSYNGFSVSLFQGTSHIDTISNSTEKTSCSLIPTIDSLLNKNNIFLKNLSFIAIDQGPGAFTSLRVTITIVNSIAFAESITLVGVDGLEALAHETFNKVLNQQQDIEIPDVLVTLLNAYNKEAFFAIHPIGKDGRSLGPAIEKNYKKIDILLDEISSKFQTKKILFTGNGSDIFREKITDTFDNAIFLDSTIETCSSKQVGKMGYEQFLNKEGVAESLYPLYLKSQSFATRKK